MSLSPYRSLALARRRHKARFGRAALFWAVLGYGLAQIAIGAMVDRWHPRIPERLPEQVWDKKRKRLFELATNTPERPLIVMLGSSRTEGAFQASRVTEALSTIKPTPLAYNFGVPAAGPLHEFLFLREMLGNRIKPCLLLIEYLPPLLNKRQRGLTSEEGWILPDGLSASHLLSLGPYLSKPAQIRREWLLSRIAPCYALRNDLHKDFRQRLGIEPWGPKRPHDPWGELLHSPPPEDWPRRQKIAFDMYYSSLQNFELGTGPKKAMRDLVECCHKNDIQAALVLMPESSGFRRWYTREGRSRTQELLDELSQQFQLPVIDATDWVCDQDFFDGHHVHQSGARVFTDRIIGEIRNLLQR